MTVTRAPRTRKPTGKVAYPLVVVDGFTGTGKTTKALMLALSPHVGQTWVCEFGEDTANEYALGDYDIIDHDGTYHGMMEELRCAVAQPMRDGKPNVIVFDSATALWDTICVWTVNRAREADMRKPKGKSILKDDKDAEVKPHSALYNDRADRFDNFVNLLRDWPGIAIVVCHGKEVTPFENGAPVANAPKEYKLDTRDYLLKQASVRIHCEDQDAKWRVSLQKCRQQPKITDHGVEWEMELPPKGLEIKAANPVEYVLFDILKAGRQWQISSVARPVSEDVTTVSQAKQLLIRKLTHRFGADATEVAAEVWQSVITQPLEASSPMSMEHWGNLMIKAADRIAGVDHPAVQEAEKVLAGTNTSEGDESSGPGDATVPRPSRVNMTWGDEPPDPEDEYGSYAPKAAPPTLQFNLSSEFGRLPGHLQAELLRFLQGEYNCTAINVPAEHVDFVRARMEQMVADAYPPFTDDDCTLEPKAKRSKAKPPSTRRPSVDHRERLVSELRRKNIIGPERFNVIERICKRRVTKIDSLTLAQAQLCADTLEGQIDEAPRLLADAS